MNDVLVLAEHLNGELKDVTFEMLAHARGVADASGTKVAAVLLGSGVGDLAERLAQQADEVLVRDHDGFAHYNSAVYQPVLADVIRGREPSVVMIGHTAFGVDLAPSLAVALDAPLASDVIDLAVEGSDLVGTRQTYGGKVNERVGFGGAAISLVTVRPAAFAPEEASRGGSVVALDTEVPDEPAFRRFVEYVEAAAGEVDITKSDVVIAIGRGIKEEENMPLITGLAELLGGVVACSRPVVDAGWLPKDRQVGSSGKTVKPKLYVAIGVSGQFQHVAGMKSAETIVAINKDPKAPIFQAAHYGIVGDLMKVVPALTEKITELRA
jgi:electron transfer flavoprotein alpha subunit